MAQRHRLLLLLLPGIALVAMAALAPTCANRPLPGADSDTPLTSGTPTAVRAIGDIARSDAGIAAAPTAPGIAKPGNETVLALYSPTRTPTATPRPPTATATATPRPPTATATSPSSGGRPMVGGCYMFPADNSWNQDISAMPVDPNSANYLSYIGAGNLHPDFGGGGAYGIPYIVVPQNQPMTQINFTAYGDESDPGPYPIPLTAPIEGGGVGDAHVIAVQQGTCKLYEMFDAHPNGGAWDAGSGAVFDLNSNALRPDGWTSADAAGLPILAGLIRYDEVQAGAINHAIRFTVPSVRRAWIHPATHYGTTTNANALPYGAKVRLKASYDISGYHGASRVILEAMKRYGMMLADQGSRWYITGAADPRWDDNDLNQLKGVPSSAFEVVQLGTVITP